MDTWANANAYARAYVRKTANSLIESIKLETLIDGQNGQLRLIADELANSVAEAAGAGSDTRFQEESFRATFVEEQKDRLKEIISAIPSAFHHYSFQTANGTATLFDLPLMNFSRLSQLSRTSQPTTSRKHTAPCGSILASWMKSVAGKKAKLTRKTVYTSKRAESSTWRKCT